MMKKLLKKEKISLIRKFHPNIKLMLITDWTIKTTLIPFLGSKTASITLYVLISFANTIVGVAYLST